MRLKGHYLALATFALALATPQLLKHNAVSNYTGGVAGITLPKLTPPAGWHITADQYLYAVTLCITAIMFMAASVIAWVAYVALSYGAANFIDRTAASLRKP